VSDVPEADLVLRNAKVATFTASQPQAQSVAIKGGRVLAVGTDDELTPLAAAARHTADLDGRVVLPGLNDSHIHAMRAGLDWERTLHWEDVRSLGEAFTRVRAATAERPAGDWIRVVGGWHSRQLRENRLPTRSELDAAAPDHPIYLQELYDRAVLNSAALARCGWDSTAADPPGGRLLRDESGALTGEITGIGAFAVPLVLAGRADQEKEEQIRGTAAMMTAFAGHGLTGIVDGGGMATAPGDYDALYELWRRGGLTVRTRLFMCGWTPGREVDDYAQLTMVGQPDFGDPMLKVSGVGEMPHSGCHDFEGLNPDFTISDASYDELLQITRLCTRHGWRISVHAVLDSSLARVLDAWEQVERETGRISRLRCSIVHADGASAASLRRVAALRAGVLVQNRLLLKGADYVRAWGQEAADAAPRLGVMRQLRITVGGGTDATRANWYSPWASIWWLVTGRSIDGATSRQESDRLSRYDAIACYTRDAAWFTSEDGFRGRLSPGYDADLCVPTADPFECAEDDLSDLRSELTMVSGRVTHARGGFEELRGRLAADIGYRAVGSG
jgi:predicted amidohydrolase YtcJ